MSCKLYIERIHPNAILPSRGTEGSAGLDLSSIEDICIDNHSTQLVSTGLRMNIPEGYYGRIAPRSSISKKYGLIVQAGVCDSDYRGEIKIMFFNPTNEYVFIEKGQTVAQLILEKIGIPEIIESPIDIDTVRGTGGFGSTNK